MSDFERVKHAMQLVAKHKFPSRDLRKGDFDMLAETALKTMWLIEQGKGDEPTVQNTTDPKENGI